MTGAPRHSIDLNADLGEGFPHDEALLTRVMLAASKPGDVVLAANGAPVTSVEDLKNAVEKSKGHIALLVKRGDSQIFVPVRIGAAG